MWMEEMGGSRCWEGIRGCEVSFLVLCLFVYTCSFLC
jgi:hypothetical protein